MIERNLTDYEEGYVVGWSEGRHIGYTEGYNDAVVDMEPRVARLWAELQTLNARIDYLQNREAEEEDR